MNYIDIAQATIAERYPLIVYDKPQMSLLPNGTILGTWAYSVPGKVRFILDKSKEIVPGVMPSDLTRTWLHDQYTLPIRLRKSQVNVQHHPLPTMAKVGKCGDCAYVDIRSAYLMFLKMGYDLEYEPRKYIGVRFSSVPHEITENKLCYAVAVAMANSKSTNISVLGEHGPFTTHQFNIYSNPCLYALASDVLSAIASQVIREYGDKIRYVNTDGYIIDRAYADRLVETIAQWGFDSRIKYEGQSEIFGVGSWKVGSSRTRRINTGATDFVSELPSADEVRWLQQRLTKIAQRAKVY